MWIIFIFATEFIVDTGFLLEHTSVLHFCIERSLVTHSNISTEIKITFFLLHRRQRSHTHQTTQEVSVWMSETYFSMSVHCWQCHNSTCTSRSSYKIFFVHHSQEKNDSYADVPKYLVVVVFWIWWQLHILCYARGETLISCSTQEISAHTIHLWPFFFCSIDTKCENQVSVVKAPLARKKIN